MFMRTKKNVKGGQKFNGVEVVSIITWCWNFEKEHYCSRDPHAPVSSERDEWEGGWVRVFSRRSLHTWGEYSPLHNTAHSTSNPRNLFFFTYFFCYYQCLQKYFSNWLCPSANSQWLMQHKSRNSKGKAAAVKILFHPRIFSFPL